MKHDQQFLSVIAAALVWLGPANAAPPDSDDEGRDALNQAHEITAAPTWFAVDVHRHADASGSAAASRFVLARERGRSQPARLRVDCFDGRTAVHIDTVGLGLGASAVAVKYSLDGGRFVSMSWQASADRSSLELSADRAI